MMPKSTAGFVAQFIVMVAISCGILYSVHEWQQLGRQDAAARKAASEAMGGYHVGELFVTFRNGEMRHYEYSVRGRLTDEHRLYIRDSDDYDRIVRTHVLNVLRTLAVCNDPPDDAKAAFTQAAYDEIAKGIYHRTKDCQFINDRFDEPIVEYESPLKTVLQFSLERIPEPKKPFYDEYSQETMAKIQEIKRRSVEVDAG